jgi:hypothetical protein
MEWLLRLFGVGDNQASLPPEPLLTKRAEKIGDDFIEIDNMRDGEMVILKPDETITACRSFFDRCPPPAIRKPVPPENQTFEELAGKYKTRTESTGPR